MELRLSLRFVVWCELTEALFDSIKIKTQFYFLYLFVQWALLYNFLLTKSVICVLYIIHVVMYSDSYFHFAASDYCFRCMVTFCFVFESNRILTGSIYLFFKQYGISFSLSFYFAFQLASNYFVLHTYTHTGVLMLLHFDWLHAVMWLSGVLHVQCQGNWKVRAAQRGHRQRAPVPTPWVAATVTWPRQTTMAPVSQPAPSPPTHHPYTCSRWSVWREPSVFLPESSGRGFNSASSPLSLHELWCMDTLTLHS